MINSDPLVERLLIERLPLGLVDLMERQFPDTSTTIEIPKRSEFHSVRLDGSFREPLITFGLGPNEDAWKRVRKAANELKRALFALEADGLREMNWQAPAPWYHQNTPLGHETLYVASIAAETATEMIRKRKFGMQVSKKRDWRSAALAKTARTIWAEEEWLAKPDLYGAPTLNALAELSLPEPERETAKKRRLNYEQHLRDYAPKTEKHDEPGPFGRFLREVLEIYGLETSAASALRSMRDAEIQINSVSNKPPKN